MTADATALYNDPTVHARRWWILATLCTGVMVVFMNNSAFNVAIPTLSRELHAPSSELQWTVAIYSLVFAGLLFTTGALGDRFGRKGILQIGLGLFLVTALMHVTGRRDVADHHRPRRHGRRRGVRAPGDALHHRERVPAR